MERQANKYKKPFATIKGIIHRENKKGRKPSGIALNKKGRPTMITL